ncbi:MAG: manganese/zinc/iron transport system substrate-binding protein [Thermomicrobiales bacterium]|nr:manganese/zinc/iron transport system substrate-binding protein [Thermomicrobiales bacterium]
MLKSMRWGLLLLVAGVTLAGCGGSGGNDRGDLSERQINAVATIGMIADVVGEVGGDRVKVTALMGSGVDPHLYKASEGDVSTLEKADVVFYNGLHLEAQLGEVLEKMGERTKTVAVTDKIPRERLRTPPEFQGNPDPHVWFDVSLWKITAEQIRDTLSELDATHKADYEQRATAYLAELDALDTYVKEQAARVPAERRVLVTAHDAFGYFGQAYGFEVHGLQGISTASEAGTADVQALADFIAAREVPAIFVESSVPPRTIEALQEAVRARGFEVQIGGQLFSDAMGDAGTPKGTYVGMVRHNIDTIVTALV